MRAKSAEDIRSSFEFVKPRKKSRGRSPSESEREDEEKHGKKKEHRHRRATVGGGDKHKKMSGSETTNTLDPNEGEPISLNRSSSSGNIPTGKRRHRRHPVGKTNRKHRSASIVADNVVDDSDDDAGLLPVSVDSSRSSDSVDIITESPR
eukprot:TRINITY_DN349_c0_g1_i3.p1 TRINITY_DN349_c0_g1~~TRINITY_DN349_c0_g1_i3.p1  ORF type:complete len:150 (-),score=28.25 TRINITY_DN349_c0_g1_i3:101-550(-)